MNTFTLFPAARTAATVASQVRMPKKKWSSETRIDPLDPSLWIDWRCRGNETHFRTGYSSHWFKIMFPAAETFDGEQNFLARMVLNFSTIGDTELSGMELYDGPNLLWKKDDCNLRGNYRYSTGEKNSRCFDPPLTINHDLFLTVGVTFGAPDIYVPEFIFYGARVLFECTDSAVADSDDLMYGETRACDILSVG